MAVVAAIREPRWQKQRLRRSSRPVSVVFLCYGNACRSQMAEAWARHYGDRRLLAQSAGVHPLGQLPPETQAVMAERGVGLEGQYSKGLEAIDWKRVDVLVNMASDAAALPLHFKGRTITWEVADPFLEPLDVYRRVRDDLEGRVRALLDDVAASPPPTTETL